jgi:hypothetical protein
MPATDPSAPGNADLDVLFGGATRARFSEHPTRVTRSETPRTLLEVGSIELASLREVMQLADGPGPHCMCLGDMVLSFEDESGRAIETITLHHGQTLRWTGHWEWSDAAFADADAFIDWLAARGVPEYVDQRAAANAAGQQQRIDRERWLAAAPSILREPLAELEIDAMGLPRRLTHAELDAVLDRLRGDPPGADADVASSLLHWFGRGAGPWSGFPAYESLPELLLIRLGTDAVLGSIADHELPESQLAGLARYFGSYDLHRTRRSDPQKLPDPLRARLLAHVRAEGIADNVQRLEAALRPAERPLPREPGATVVAVHPDRALSQLAARQGSLFAVEGQGIVRFDPGGGPTPLIERERMFASLAVDDEHLYAALINEGTVLKIAHAGGEAIVLAEGRGRPMGLCIDAGELAWLDQPWVPDPARPPYSMARTIVCTVPTTGGPVRELARYDGAGWDLAWTRKTAAWVRRVADQTTIASVARVGGPITTIIPEFDDCDAAEGFVHLAGTPDALILAVPTTSWLRKGVELRRHALDGRKLGVIDFVAGRFQGLDANEFGIGLVVERGSSLVVTRWDPSGRSTTMKVPRQAGPLVEPHAAEDGVYFAVGPLAYRLG